MILLFYSSYIYNITPIDHPQLLRIPTEGELHLYLRYFGYTTYIIYLCSYSTYNRLVLWRIHELLCIPTEAILLTTGYEPCRHLNRTEYPQTVPTQLLTKTTPISNVIRNTNSDDPL